MKVLVIIGMGIIGWAVFTLLAPGPAAPAGVGQIGPYACPNHPNIRAAWVDRCPLCETPLHRGQPPMVIRVHDPAGPAIDMDNSRWIDEDRARWARQREKLQEQYPNNAYPSGGYIYMRLPKGQHYPPGGYAYPGLSNGYDYYPGGRFYPYNNAPPGYYRDPATGQYHVNPQRAYPGSGPYRGSNK